jgi:hypothetical protein
MRRFRTHWLALFGALVILSLSLSSAFGARPPLADETTNVGQQVSTFVHSLTSAEDDEDGDADESEDGDEDCDTDSDTDEDSDEDGAEDSDEDGAEDSEDADEGDEDADEGDDDADEGDEDADEGDEDADGCDEQSGDEDTDEDADEDADDEDSDEGSEVEGASHGQCVAEAAHSDETGDNGTHGWAVSLAARVTCWLEQLADDENTDEDADEDAGEGDEDATDETEATSAKPLGKSEAAHQRKADRGSGKPTWAGSNAPGGHGHGHGKGGNH